MSKKREVAEVAGRPYWRQPEAERIVEAWQESGETGAAFARRHGVDPQRLSRWALRLRRSAPVPFHPVRVAGAGPVRPGGAAIEIDFGTGWRVRVAGGFEAEDLRRVLAVLDDGPPC
jgi:hypothetical protein